MRLRALTLSFSAFCALVYPLLLWQKKVFVSSIPLMEGMANWFWIAEPLFLALFFFASAAAVRQKVLQYACIIAASFFLALCAGEIWLRGAEENHLSSFRSRAG